MPKYAEANPAEWAIKEPKLYEYFQYFEEWVEKTKVIGEQCSFDFDFKTSKNKRLFANSKTDDIELLRKLTTDGMIYRYGKNNKSAQERIEKELTIIYELDFCSYFLITWDFIRYARSRGYFHVGRGSGANSIVAYCIGITDVNPIELGTLHQSFSHFST